MRYDAVIFDLDGTLLNTLDDLAAAVNAALTACGYPTQRNLHWLGKRLRQDLL